MIFNRNLTVTEIAALQAKATRDLSTIPVMLNAKIAQYLVDVLRDNGADTDAQLAKKIAAMTEAQKSTLLLSI